MVMPILILLKNAAIAWDRWQVLQKEEKFIPQSDEHSTRQIEEESAKNTSNKVQESFQPSIPLLTNTDFGRAFGNYYGAINDKQYSHAYSSLTEKCRNRMGSLASFAEGRKNTLSVEVIDFQQVIASPTQVNCNYRLRTKDSTPNGVLVQEFFGNVTLVKSGNQWFIDEIASSLTDSHIE